MTDGFFHVPKPENEPILGYLAGSPERLELKSKLRELKNKKIEIPLIIGGKEIRTGNLGECRPPHDHQHILADYHRAGPEEVRQAIDAALAARQIWGEMDWHERAAIFLKMADLLAGPYRSTLNAATMLSQSKNVFQAEIDAACELVDFFRFNTHYMTQIYQEQPYSPKFQWNQVDYRPLEGFIFAVTPFNFTSIAGNLPTAPAIMGNVVVWKPASSAVYSAYYLMKLFQKAGLPAGVINFIPGSGAEVGDLVLAHESLAGVHFTGSTAVLQHIMQKIHGCLCKDCSDDEIPTYRNIPRIVGETGGKDFVFAHSSADVDELVAALVRGAFEYSGQKCSAASRTYIPESLWDPVKTKLISAFKEIRMGDVEDFRTLINAVIDRAAFRKITSYIEHARESPETDIIAGGTYDDTKGYFIAPTVVLTRNPSHKLICEEIFGPVLTVYVYPDSKYEETLRLCDQTSPYGLTGAIFAKDRQAITTAARILRYSAGNFYINDKPTGAVVGQQPFGGARASGTNDKAGSMFNLLRWVSPRTIKENFLPPRYFAYPYMVEE
ncbi:MAG: L-glutamate gamma-semialdehyde dehydrogenase [Candidatus Hodarchaeota archaeon]